MAGKVVIDASVALKWQFKDELETEQAIQMLSDLIEGKIGLISPSLFAYEIVNAIHIAIVRERIPGEEGLDAIIGNSVVCLLCSAVSCNISSICSIGEASDPIGISSGETTVTCDNT